MNDEIKKKILLVALGGNALIRKGQVGTVDEQFENLKVPIRHIARLSRHYRIIITHGNGPQVGNLLLQQELQDAVPRLPLEILVAQTQGQIGYMIESTLDSELMALGISTQKPLVSLISYVVVDERDSAFQNPWMNEILPSRILPNPLARSSRRRRPQPFLTPHERQKRDTAAL